MADRRITTAGDVRVTTAGDVRVLTAVAAGAWPAGLPLPMLPISGQPQPGALLTPNDVGPPLSRVRVTATPEQLTFRLVLTNEAQFEEFEAFWRDDLRSGVTPIALDIDYTGTDRDLRILGYTWQVLGTGRYEVICDAEILASAA